jgi:hypothetical protein
MTRLFCTLSLLLALLLPVPSWAAVVYDANVQATNQDVAAATTCVTPSITVNSNSDRLATVEFSAVSLADTTYTVTGVTGGSLTWVQAGRTSGTSLEDMSVEILSAVAPSSGGSLSATLTFSPGIVSGDDVACAIRSFSGVDQGTPVSGYTGNYTDNDTPSVTIASANGNYVIGVTGGRRAWVSSTGCNTGEDYDASVQWFHWGGNCASTGASQTISYTLSFTGPYAIGGVNIVATGGAPAGPPIGSRNLLGVGR